MILSDKFICATNTLSTQRKPVAAPLFKKVINVKNDIEKAEITITALGFYELYINAEKVTRGRLSPHISNSDDAVFYDNYDICEMLVSGENTFEFLLGNGMQNCYGGYIWELDKTGFRSSPKFAFAIEITYKNGEKEIIEADESVLVKKSKLLSNDLRLGEGFNISDGLCSHNHHFWGFISDFFMTEICGIKPQIDKIYISPNLPKDMNYAKAKFKSIYGDITVEIKRENGNTNFNLITDERLINEKIFVSKPDNITT